MKIILFANTDWYIYNFRRSLALALQGAGHEVLLVSPPGPYGEKLQAMGFRWVAAPMNRRSLNPLRELALLCWLRRLMQAERVDLVHSFTIKCAVYGSLAARWAARSRGVPARVNAVAGMGYVFTSGDAKARLLRPLVRALLKLALGGPGARLVLQNPDDAALFERARLVDAEQVRLVLGSGVNCERFQPRPVGARAAGAAFTVVLPARLLWDKGLAEYAEAARMLRAEGRAVRLLLAGDPDPGNPAAVPEATVRGWVAGGLMEWLGHVEDMPMLFARVDAVALPSYREGLPKGLIEAAACGLPLIATDVPGCREVVTHEANGLLVPVKDGAALAGAMTRLSEDRELCERLGRGAREDALARFDERLIVERTMAVYDELLTPVARGSVKSERTSPQLSPASGKGGEDAAGAGLMPTELPLSLLARAGEGRGEGHAP